MATTTLVKLMALDQRVASSYASIVRGLMCSTVEKSVSGATLLLRLSLQVVS